MRAQSLGGQCRPPAGVPVRPTAAASLRRVARRAPDRQGNRMALAALRVLVGEHQPSRLAEIRKAPALPTASRGNASAATRAATFAIAGGLSKFLQDRVGPGCGNASCVAK